MSGAFWRHAARCVSVTNRCIAPLAFRYHSPESACFESVNQLFRAMRLPYAYRLTTVGIETNNTCNLSCTHCPTNRGMKREKGYMGLNTFKRIIDLNSKVRRVYLTNWGEPLMHPAIVEMIRYARAQGKQTAITTNGTMLDASMSRDLLGSGLNIIKFSVDGGQRTFERLRGNSYEEVRQNILQFIHFRNTLKKPTWVEVSMLVYEETASEIVPFIDSWTHHADFVNLQPRFFSIKRHRYSLCRDLWRILVILWDGKVVPCCADCEGKIVLGDASKGNLQSLFKGKALIELRRKHLRREFPAPCDECRHYHSEYYLSPRNIAFGFRTTSAGIRREKRG